MCAQAGLSFFDARLSLTSKRERKIKLANQLAQGRENSPWTRRDLKRLDYYPPTLILGRPSSRSDPPTETDAMRLFQLIGRAIPISASAGTDPLPL